MQLGTDAEFEVIAKAIRQAMESGRIPPVVTDVLLTLDNDHVGDPAAFLMVLLKDDISDEAFESLDLFDLSEIVWETGTERFPFVSVRLNHEQEEAAQEEIRFRRSVKSTGASA